MGSGKSACFEAYLIAWRMFPSNRESGVIVLIIEPLISIMSQSVEKMRVAGWRATYIGRDCNEDNGTHHLVASAHEGGGVLYV